MRGSLKGGVALGLLWTVGLAGCSMERNRQVMRLAGGVDETALEEKVEDFEPAEISFDETALADWEKAVLAKLVEASDIMHQLFARQVSRRNPDWRAQVAARGADDPAAIYYDIMVGPWDRQSEQAPFLDAGPKPAGAGFYPEDMTKEELRSWAEAHPEQKEALESPFTIIERQGDSLAAVPYSEAYHPELEKAAALLREAAALAQNNSLSDYLDSRAASFLSNDYYPSDVAWMDIAGTKIEPTIGPYEVYEDNLFGYKAAFESFVTVADSAASAELDRLKESLPMLEEKLPEPPQYRNMDRGFESPIRVVDVVYTAGDTRAGVQTLAFNLPNDERVRQAKGSKKVMLRNVSHAKFDKILEPIAHQLLDPSLIGEVRFQPWFTSTLMHELAHGLGPGFISRDGERTTVNQALQDRYSAIEEAKADVVGLYNLTVLRDQGVYDDDFVRAAFISKLPDLFRGVRFGAGEAHGKANLIQVNWMLEHGALRFDDEGRITGDLPAMEAAVKSLATEILTLEAEGDYDRAGRLLDTYGHLTPELQAAVARIGDVPVDIRPVFEVRDLLPEWDAIAKRLYAGEDAAAQLSAEGGLDAAADGGGHAAAGSD